MDEGRETTMNSLRVSQQKAGMRQRLLSHHDAIEQIQQRFDEIDHVSMLVLDKESFRAPNGGV